MPQCRLVCISCLSGVERPLRTVLRVITLVTRHSSINWVTTVIPLPMTKEVKFPRDIRPWKLSTFLVIPIVRSNRVKISKRIYCNHVIKTFYLPFEDHRKKNVIRVYVFVGCFIGRERVYFNIKYLKVERISYAQRYSRQRYIKMKDVIVKIF